MFFIWEKPGHFINASSDVDAFTIQTLILSMEDYLIEANVALHLFEEEQSLRNSRSDLQDVWEQDQRYRGEAERIIIGEKGEVDFTDREAYDRRRFEIQLTALQLKIESGAIPEAHINKMVWLHAKSFVHALDNFFRFMGQITAIDDRESLNVIREMFLTAIPALRGVRNSISHVDERTLGKRRVRGTLTDIDLKPMDNAIAKGTVNLVSVLNGNKYGCTMENGHYGEIEISDSTMLVMMRALKEVYSSYEWRGGPTVMPSR